MVKLVVHCTSLPERAREGKRPGRRRVLRPADDAGVVHLPGTCCTPTVGVTEVSAEETAAVPRLSESTAGAVKEGGCDGADEGDSDSLRRRSTVLDWQL